MMVMIILILMMMMMMMVMMMMSDDGDDDDAAQHGKCQRTITLAIVPEFLTPVQTVFFSLNMTVFFSCRVALLLVLFRFIIQNGAQRCETTPFPRVC